VCVYANVFNIVQRYILNLSIFTMMIYGITSCNLIFASLFIANYSVAQNPAVSNFSGVQYKDSVLLSFVMNKGYSCNGINIERSEDSLNFYLIGDIQGVCGNPDFEVSFLFVDKSPLQNADNFYRLDFGNLGNSEIIKIRFTKFNIAGYLFFPNPCNGNCSLYFENPKNSEVEFLLFHFSGKLIEHKKQRGTQISINTGKFSSGIYFYRLIKNDEIKIAGKFVVL